MSEAHYSNHYDCPACGERFSEYCDVVANATCFCGVEIPPEFSNRLVGPVPKPMNLEHPPYVCPDDDEDGSVRPRGQRSKQHGKGGGQRK